MRLKDKVTTGSIDPCFQPNSKGFLSDFIKSSQIFPTVNSKHPLHCRGMRLNLKVTASSSDLEKQ